MRFKKLISFDELKDDTQVFAVPLVIVFINVKLI